MVAPIRASRDRVIDFRLASHHLSQRLPTERLLEAAACGLQNSPPGSAALALLARVDGIGPVDLTQALERDKMLLQIRSMRAAPHLVPTRDMAVFTTGLLPRSEAELRYFILGANPALDKAGISATLLVDLTATALLAALDGRAMPFRALSADLTERVAERLTFDQLAAWRSPSVYGSGCSLGEAMVHFALYLLALQGLYCYAPRRDDEATFVRTDQWLCEALPPVEPDTAQTELLRRYLRCYGPSTAQHFGEWTGIAPAAAARAWARIEPELVAVAAEGQRGWLHQEDLSQLTGPTISTGVRLLPPHDPFLSLRDRATLLPRVSLHKHVWRTTGNPGVVLADGRVAGLWRPQKNGRRLRVMVDTLEALDEHTRSGIANEASQVAAWRGLAAAEIVYSDGPS